MAKKSKPKPAGTSVAGGVDLTEAKRLLAFMEEHGLEEFEYTRGGVHLRLKKASIGTSPAPRMPSWDPPATGHSPAAEAPRPVAGHAAAPPASDVHVIKSPIVGTFYASPSPNADAFVSVGARVEPGQVLCIIEAMKLMNEIESDVAGEVVQVFVENGKPVEYGESLFGIRARAKK
ncbi:MAG TPA: acetyl-CoA carboxylase biotin carboxyl carrier protein [Candidatus Acidoferrales bacterium]